MGHVFIITWSHMAMRYSLTILCVCVCRSRTSWRMWCPVFSRPTVRRFCWAGWETAPATTTTSTCSTSPPAGQTAWPSTPSYTTSGDTHTHTLRLLSVRSLGKGSGAHWLVQRSREFVFISFGWIMSWAHGNTHTCTHTHAHTHTHF